MCRKFEVADIVVWGEVLYLFERYSMQTGMACICTITGGGVKYKSFTVPLEDIRPNYIQIDDTIQIVVKYGKVEAKDTIEIKSFSRKGSGTIVVDYYNKTTGNFGAVNYKEIKKVFLQYI